VAPAVNLQIEAATEHDVPLILEFIRELAAYEKHLDRVEATEARIRETLFGDHPAASVVFALVGDRPVGFAVFYFAYSTFAGLRGLYLEDLFVKSEVRGLGIGRELLRYLARLAKENGCWGMQWAVLHWNATAIGFYRKLGAVPIEDCIDYRLLGAAFDRLAAEG
jgi:GNAT superfamily N-acetyltransferase